MRRSLILTSAGALLFGAAVLLDRCCCSRPGLAHGATTMAPFLPGAWRSKKARPRYQSGSVEEGNRVL